jgi:hypothetical protein
MKPVSLRLVADGIRTPVQPLQTVTSIAEAPEELVNATESNISSPWPRYKAGIEMSGNNTGLKDTVNCETLEPDPSHSR